MGKGLAAAGAWAVEQGKSALDNPVVRMMAICLVLAVACTDPLTCNAVGAAVGASLGAANWCVNHRKESLVTHMVSGAVDGALVAGQGIALARVATSGGFIRASLRANSVKAVTRGPVRVGPLPSAKAPVYITPANFAMRGFLTVGVRNRGQRWAV